MYTYCGYTLTLALQLSKKTKLCRQKPHPRGRSLWLEDFHRYPTAEHHCLHSVRPWYGSLLKNFVVFSPFTFHLPSLLPSFLPSVSFRRRRHRRPSITRVKVISQLVLAQRPWSLIYAISRHRVARFSLWDVPGYEAESGY